MVKKLSSDVIELDGPEAAMDYAWEHGWTDGLPIVPPTPERVAAFLEYAQLEPDQIVAEYHVRNRGVSAEKVAINAVMAGCKPEYMPVITTALEAMCDPVFRLNHIASTSSPWPMFIVNGPIAHEIGLHNGQYCLGPGHRANVTIGRAMSLILANCLDARPGGVQQGTMGNPCRLGGQVIAEREDTSWVPLSFLRGYPMGANVVTVMGTMEPPQDVRVYGMPTVNTAESLSTVLAEYVSDGWFAPGTFVIVISPEFQRVYLDAGWSKQDLIRFLEENTRTSVARLKRKARWPAPPGHTSGIPPIEPGDETKWVYHAKAHPTSLADMQTVRKADYLIALAGGDVAGFAVIFRPYPTGTAPVSRVIRRPGEKA